MSATTCGHRSEYGVCCRRRGHLADNVPHEYAIVEVRPFTPHVFETRKREAATRVQDAIKVADAARRRAVLVRASQATLDIDQLGQAARQIEGMTP